MNIIVSVSVGTIATCLGWLLFATPPRFMSYLFIAAIVALLSCAAYALISAAT